EVKALLRAVCAAIRGAPSQDTKPTISADESAIATWTRMPSSRARASDARSSVSMASVDRVLRGALRFTAFSSRRSGASGIADRELGERAQRDAGKMAKRRARHELEVREAVEQ